MGFTSHQEQGRGKIGGKGGVSERLHGSQLLAGLKPEQSFELFMLGTILLMKEFCTKPHTYPKKEHIASLLPEL